jgi:hypothetical protein
MDRNTLEYVSLDMCNNDNTNHQRDQKMVIQRHHEQEAYLTSASPSKAESEMMILAPETVKDESPATYRLIFITISLVLVVLCVALVKKNITSIPGISYSANIF